MLTGAAIGGTVGLLVGLRQQIGGLLGRMITRRRSRPRRRWCPLCRSTLQQMTPGQMVEHVGRCRSVLVTPAVTGGRSPIVCGRHPDVPGGWSPRLLVDGMPAGWYCPACRGGAE